MLIMNKFTKFGSILILSLALVLAACGPTATQLPSEPQVDQDLPPTPEPTAVPVEPTAIPVEPTATTAVVEPTATLVPAEMQSGDPAVFLGEPDGVDTFDNADNWTLFDNQCFKSEITDGKYIMTAKGLPGIVCWEVSWPLIKDFYNEITIDMPEQCQPDDRFGLLFRAPDNLRGYLYGLTCDGRYTLTMWDGETTTVLLEPTASELITTGPEAVNRIGVVAYGSSYYLYANGVFLAEAQDATFLQEGMLGLYVRTSTELPFTVAYDDLGVWVLDDQYYPPESSSPPPPTEELPPPEAGAATVTTFTYVNVRSGPGTQYPKYFVAAPGATGQAVGITEDGAWYAITLPTTVSGTGTGWISATYVIPANTEGLPVVSAPPPPPSVEVPPPVGTTPTVTNFEPLNVRSGPGNQYASYGVAPIGSSATVIGISADGIWYVIVISTDYAPDGVGWVHSDYVTLSNPSGVEIPVISNPDQLPPVAPPPPAADAATVTAFDVINVRNGPSNQCTSYGVASIGASAVATGINADGTWYQIQISTEYAPDGIGWVNANYVSTSNTENLPVAVSQYCP
jgi:uncharacterized protein YraI